MPEIPPWIYWPAAVAGGLVALGVLWKYAVVGVGHAFWVAILAAPQIATGVQELGDLLKGNVLDRLDAHARRLDGLETEWSAGVGHRDVTTARLDAHELAIAELRALNTAARLRETNGDLT